MAIHRPFEHHWRRSAAHLGTQLRRAHVAVHSVAATIDKGRTRSAHRRYATARHRIAAIAGDVAAFRAQRPGPEHLGETAAAGSALTLRGAEAATLSLDVMLDAVMALRAVDDRRETELLIGACIDAEQGFAQSVAVVRAAATAHAAAVRTLSKAFDSDGEQALRLRLVREKAALAGLQEPSAPPFAPNSAPAPASGEAPAGR